MHHKPKVFLSGGFRSNWQKSVIDQVGDDFIFFNPREHGLNDPGSYTVWDIHFVKECNILFAYMEKTNPSGYGLAFEAGLALGLNKTIILVDERSEKDPSFENYFQIVRHSSAMVFNNLADGIALLQRFSHADQNDLSTRY
ncbi:nucleoside 2-deoxyribosyltransferase domain-containing protein [Rubrolithibacter danxiaensis]|uniref:nucleoside 2-deoxyribosyltransferase domain-containing protein n=1 Tax=Rubrolithibacter danxiaensis TaxID=3390805 RepID=UPI003BF7C31A